MAGKFNLTARILYKLNAKTSLLCLKAIDSILDHNVIDSERTEFSNFIMEVSRERVEKHFIEMQKDSDFGMESKWKCNEDILSPMILGSIPKLHVVHSNRMKFYDLNSIRNHF